LSLASVFSTAHNSSQRRNQRRSRTLQFLVMMQSEFGQNALAFGGECQQYLSAVIPRARAPHISPTFQTVDQFHRAVMLNLHPVGQFPNARPHSLGYAFDRKHQLVLPAFQTGCLHRSFAEMQEPANLIPELR